MSASPPPAHLIDEALEQEIARMMQAPAGAIPTSRQLATVATAVLGLVLWARRIDAELHAPPAAAGDATAEPIADTGTPRDFTKPRRRPQAP